MGGGWILRVSFILKLIVNSTAQSAQMPFFLSYAMSIDGPARAYFSATLKKKKKKTYTLSSIKTYSVKRTVYKKEIADKDLCDR